MRNFTLKLTVLTASCFFLSWLLATASGVNKVHAYPNSLLKSYAAVGLATGNVAIKRTFSGKDIDELVIEASATDIRLERSPTGFVEITLNGNYPTTQEPLISEVRERKLELSVRELDLGNNFRLNIHFDESEGGLVVRVPDNIKRVTVKTLSGDLQADSLQLRELAVKTKSGDVSLDHFKADSVVFKSISGDLEGDRSEIRRFLGDTVSGDVTLNLENNDPSLEAASTSGDIDLTVRGRPSLNLEFYSVSGDLDVDGENERTIGKDGRISMKLGAGKGGLVARTVSGDLRISGL